MAQPSRLSHRIERLLNESSFTKAFTASRRALAAVVAAPLVLAASAALVQVHAAVPQQNQTDQRADQSLTAQPTAQQTNPPAQPQNDLPPTPPAEPGAAPPPPPPADAAMPPAPPMAPMGPSAPMAPMVPMAPGAPMPPAEPGMMPPPDAAGPGDPPQIMGDMHPELWRKRIVVHARPPYGRGPNGEPWALGDDSHEPMPGFTPEEMDKARKMTKGHFFVFRHEGKVYVVDDAATVAELEAARNSSVDLEEKMRAVSREQGEKARKMAEQARQVRANLQVKVPDLTNEMAEVNKAMTELKAKQGSTISPQDLGELEHKLGELQLRLGQAQFEGLKHLDVHIDEAAMHQFEEQMRTMGKQIGQAFRTNDEKAKSTIEESLKNGKARPVQ